MSLALSTGGRFDATAETFVIQDTARQDKRQNGIGVSSGDIAYTLDGQGNQGIAHAVFYNPHRTLQKDGSVVEGFKPDEITDALHGPTGNKEPLIAIVPLDMRQLSRGEKMTNNRPGGSSGGPPGTGIGNEGDPSSTVCDTHVPAIAYAIQERAVSDNPDVGPQGKGWQEEQAFTLEARHHQQAVAKQGVRRLTPTECARLQGFPDDWLDGLSDSAKYRVLGNAVSVPVAEWIGRRMIEADLSLARK